MAAFLNSSAVSSKYIQNWNIFFQSLTYSITWYSIQRKWCKHAQVRDQEAQNSETNHRRKSWRSNSVVSYPRKDWKIWWAPVEVQTSQGRGRKWQRRYHPASGPNQQWPSRSWWEWSLSCSWSVCEPLSDVLTLSTSDEFRAWRTV